MEYSESVMNNVETTDQSSASALQERRRQKVIGIYGISGAGKSFLMYQLRTKLGHDNFKYFEGSEVIDAIAPGGLTGFKKMVDVEKLQWRVTGI